MQAMIMGMRPTMALHFIAQVWEIMTVQVLYAKCLSLLQKGRVARTTPLPEGPVTTGISYTASWNPLWIPNQNPGIHVEYVNIYMNLIIRCMNIIRNLPESATNPGIHHESK